MKSEDLKHLPNRAPPRPQSGKPHPCPDCHKRFRKIADVAQHRAAAHGSKA